VEADNPAIWIQYGNQIPGCVDDGGSKVPLFGKSRLRLYPAGDVSQGPFVVADRATRVPNRPRIFERPHDSPVPGQQLQLPVTQLPILLELGQAGGPLLWMDIQCFDVDLQELRLRVVTEHLYEGSIGGEEPAVRGALVDAIKHVVEQLAILRLGGG